jgi:hypothetical protein
MAVMEEGCKICGSHSDGYEELYVLASTQCSIKHTGFLLGLHFDPEDGGVMFLRNVS